MVKESSQKYMFVKLWIIFLKGRKQKNMIWNHLEKKQGGKTYSTHPFFFGSLDGCQCFEDHFTWATWWSSSTRTLPSSAIQACRMLAGLLISKDAQWWRVCLQRRSQPSWFLPNSEWRNIPKKRCVGNKYGFQFIIWLFWFMASIFTHCVSLVNRKPAFQFQWI